MSFITFNTEYYRNKIEYYSNAVLTFDEVREAKQLLKILDDLVSEGYLYLNDELEKSGFGAIQLREIISKYGETPFEVASLSDNKSCFNGRVCEVSSYIDGIMSEASNCNEVSDNPVIDELLFYSDWIKKEDDTAYVFLLRDTLIPYIYFCASGMKSVYPWMIGRRFTEIYTKEKYFDDAVREPIYNALEKGITDYSEFKQYCCSHIRQILLDHPQLANELKRLLGSIKEERIVVVESGYCGTFPLLLSALDDRVDFKMFTTAPFLKHIYKERIYTDGYEQIRNIETLYSQEMLFELFDYKDGKFFVCENTDTAVRDRALKEINKVLCAIKERNK